MAKKTTKNAAEAQMLPAGYVPELKTVYKEQIVPALMKQFSYTTVMQVPRLVKITSMRVSARLPRTSHMTRNSLRRQQLSLQQS